MKPKHLAILGAVVVALLLLRVLIGASDPEVASELEDAGIVRLVPEDFDPAAVSAIRIEPGAAMESADADPDADADVLVVARDGDAWRVRSAPGGGAPAEGERIDSFLEEIASLTGELRGEGEGDFEEFGVDDSATRLVFEDAAGETLLALRLGAEAGAPQTTFLRREDSDAVQHVRTSLRQDLGLWSGRTTPPETHWIALAAVEIDEDDVELVRVERADATWVLERAAAGNGTEGDGDETAERDWTLVEPALPWPTRDATLSSQVSRLATVRAAGLLDPAEVDACEAAADDGAARVTLVGDDSELVSYRVGPTVSPSGDDGADGVGGDESVVLRVGESGPCWKLTTWSARSLLPRAASVLDVPEAFEEPPASDEIDALTIERAGEDALRLTRHDDDTWMHGDGEVSAGRVSRVISALRGLRADDVVPESALTSDHLTVDATVTARAGGERDERLVVELLGRRDAPGGGRYARTRPSAAAPDDFVAVLADTTVDSLLPTLDDLTAE